VILADTSVWVDHLRSGDRELANLLNNGRILMHPYVLGEIALGNLRSRAAILEHLSELPAAPKALDDEVLALISQNALHGIGLGLIDVHLLAAARLIPPTTLWTRDRRLNKAASTLGLASDLS
jgi:predicted nucleic acid-binding protein